MTPIARATKAGIDKWDCIKLKNFCAAEGNNTVKPTAWLAGVLSPLRMTCYATAPALPHSFSRNPSSPCSTLRIFQTFPSTHTFLPHTLLDLFLSFSFEKKKAISVSVICVCVLN